eukprot:702257-Prorocentrum_minimum.AAC.1
MGGEALNRQRDLESFSEKVNRALCCCFSDSEPLRSSDIVRAAPKEGAAASDPRAARTDHDRRASTEARQARRDVKPDAWWLSKVSAGNANASYEYGRVLGRGASSVVREGVSRRTGEKFACKIMTLKGTRFVTQLTHLPSVPFVRKPPRKKREKKP